MNEAKWTPGPWHVNGSQVIGKAGRRNQYVADANRQFDVATIQANARLIAAAPELYDALWLAQATIERLERHAPGSANGTLDVVKKALAKATGQQ